MTVRHDLPPTPMRPAPSRPVPDPVPVDRRERLAELAEALAEGLEGDGGLVWVTGEHGVGKTRLIDAALRLQRPARVRAVRCAPERVGDAYGVVLGLFDDCAAALARLLRRPTRPWDCLPTIASALQRDRLPVLLRIEDVQWADRDSLDLLAYVLPRLRGRSVVLVLCGAPCSPGHDRALDAFARLVVDRGTRFVHVPPLGTAAVREIALRHGRCPDRVAAEAHGVPLLAYAALDGTEPGAEAGERLATRTAQRLAALDPAVRTAAFVLSMHERALATADALRLPEVDAGAIAALARSGFVAEPAGSIVVFRHPAVRRCVRELALRELPADVHRDASERLAGSEPEAALWHALAAGRSGACDGLLFVAIGRMASGGRLDEACVAAETSLRALGPDTAEAARVEDLLAFLLARLGRIDDASARAASARRHWWRAGRPDDWASHCALTESLADPVPLPVLAAGRDAAFAADDVSPPTRVAWRLAQARLAAALGEADRSRTLAAAALDDIDGLGPAVGGALAAEALELHVAVLLDTPPARLLACVERALCDARGVERLLAVDRVLRVLPFLPDAGLAERWSTLLRGALADARPAGLVAALDVADTWRGLRDEPAEAVIGRCGALLERRELGAQPQRLARLALAVSLARAGVADPAAGGPEDVADDPTAGPLERTLAALVATEREWLADRPASAAVRLAEAAERTAAATNPMILRALAVWQRLVADGPRLEAGGPGPCPLVPEACEIEAGAEGEAIGERRRAVTVAKRQGMLALQRALESRWRTQGLRSIPRGPLSRTLAAPGQLTRRELIVARLIASGLSNPEIALRLHRSVRTIDNQVASIFRKLGVSSRREIAAWLRTHVPDGAAGPRAGG